MMNDLNDFKRVIIDQRKDMEEIKWEGSTLDYLYMIKNNPNISQLAPGRIYDMIMSYGVEDVDESLKIRGYEDLVRYKFFDNKIFGLLEPIHDLMRFLKASARRTETGKRIMILVGPVAGGKCLSGDTKIYNVIDGKFYRIEDIVNNKIPIKVQSYTHDGKTVVSNINNFFKNGKQKLYRIKLEDGSSVKATENHMFKTFNEWKPISELEIGEFISLTRNLEPPKNTTQIPDEIIKLYAYYLAEGGTGPNGSVAFSNKDTEIVLDFYDCARYVEPSCTLKDYSRDGRTWHPTCERGKGNLIKDFIKEFDLKDKLSYEKNVKDIIFTLSNDKIALFLGTLWSCDGYISKNGRTSYSTSNMKFAYDVKNLLLRLGIFSSVHIKKTYRRDNYSVSVSGRENREIFHNIIGPHILGTKKLRLERMLDYRKFSFCDSIPKDIYSLIVEEYKNKGLSIHGKHDGIRDNKQRIDWYKDENISRDKLLKIAEYSGSEKLKRISLSDVHYKRVSSIEYVGEDNTYDIEIPDTHNFVIDGGVITHNSSIVALIKRGLEEYSLPKYSVVGCPIHEDPLHFIPYKDRQYWEDELGIKIEGTPCPVCLQRFKNTNWDEIPVEAIKFSEQERIGIGTFMPNDPKCVKYDTILVSNKGMLTFGEIQENLNSIKGEFKDFEIKIDGVNGIKQTSKFFNNGVQHINKIVTKLGYEIECTDVHPLLTIEDGEMNWKKTSDIKTGDYIGIKKGSMIFGNNNLLDDFEYDGALPAAQYKNTKIPKFLDDGLSKILGYLVADGNIDKMGIWFTNKNKDIISDFCYNFEVVFNVKPKVYERANGIYTVSISSQMLSAFFKDVLGMKQGAYNKEMPLCVRRSSKEIMIGFLEGLFWGDGTINHTRFKYASVSKTLAKQVQISLLNIGIVSSMYFGNMNYNNNICYNVSVTGDDIVEFLEKFPSLRKKNTEIDNIRESRKNIHSQYDVIPNIDLLFRNIFDDIKNVINKPIYKMDIKRYYRYMYPYKKPTRFTVLKFCNDAENILGRSSEAIMSLREVCNNNIIWLPVVRKIDSGYDQVYDLTIPDTHSFCANGFINHNSQDVTELIGRVNVSKLNRYGESDPRCYQFDGELQVGNGGMVEMVELLKMDTKLMYVLISLAQEQVIKTPGFPQMYIDTLIVGHSNQQEFDTFKSDKKNEALHDRMYPIMNPWNVRVDDEIRIYEKMIKESGFHDIHIAPNTLKIAAEFAVLSRLTPSTKISSLIEKMKVYNGEITEELKKKEIDVKTLRQEGIDKGEGMKGISPRFIINALNVALGMKEDKKCVNPIDIIRALRSNFDHHIGIEDKEKEHLLTLLIGEKESVSSEYKEIAKKEVNMAFLSAYDEQAQTLFDNYINNAEAFCKKEKVYDSITGEYSNPDEKLMRQIEEFIGVPVGSKDEFRNGIFVYKSGMLESGKPFTFKDYGPLKTAIEKKLMSDLRNVVSLTIADKSATDRKTKTRRASAIKMLKQHGYCDECANVLLAFVAEVIRRES